MSLEKMSTEELIKFIEVEYGKNKRSWPELAEELGTYPNKLVRFAKKHDIVESRSRSEAQALALEQGRHKHPTKGTKRDEETCRIISDKVSQSWQNLTEEELEERRQISRDNWDALPESKKEEIRAAAAKGVRRAAVEGSRLENYLQESLTKAGFQVEFHKDDFLTNKELEVDIFVVDAHTAIEIDGPSHFLPIWGQDALNRNIKSDKQKNGLLLNSGYVVIRVKNTSKNTSKKQMREASEALVKMLNQIKEKFPTKKEDRILEVEV